MTWIRNPCAIRLFEGFEGGKKPCDKALCDDLSQGVRFDERLPLCYDDKVAGFLRGFDLGVMAAREPRTARTQQERPPQHQQIDMEE